MTWEEAVLWLRGQPDQAALVRACFYDDPLLEAARRFHASTEWTATRALLPRPPGRALDLGSGRGIAAFALARDGWDVVALEPDPSAVVGAGAIRALAAEAGLAIEVREDWGEALPFPDASFEIVYGRAVMHHARDLERFCREAARVLAPGGVFVGVREHVISAPGDLPRFLEAHPLHHLYGGEAAHPLARYVGALRAAGLRLSHVLNPFASDVNLYPSTREAVRADVAARLHLPSARWVPGLLLDLIGARLPEPGRLYSFVAQRPHG